ncbi:Uncharacterised protein [Mycobacteroides abscessus subsp. bolletii]|nr:Uncharacterised protein [Mycobacteroides abscessus subsp. bolletii]SKN23625.1 Uncharacterised protein [Mycobacteroides abscessus subsp. bolletii]
MTRILADRTADTLHDLDLAAARLPEKDSVQDRDVDAFRQAPRVGHEVETIVAILRQPCQSSTALLQFHGAVDVFGDPLG